MSPLTSSARPRRRIARPGVLVPVAIIAAGAVAATVTLTGHSGARDSGAQAPAQVSGWPQQGAVLEPAALDHVSVPRGTVPMSEISATLDGRALSLADTGGTVTLPLGHVPDGRHTLALSVAGHHYTSTFTVDGTPPQLTVHSPGRLPMDKPLALSGTVDAGAKVVVNGQPATVAAGAWHVTFPQAPSLVTVVATDAAGNTTTDKVPVTFELPLTRAVHMTALAWSYLPLRNPVLALARAHKINAVEVDIKDEDGIIGYKSRVPLAIADGATEGAAYDAKKMIAELHALHVRVIGRLVAFHDPKLAGWAWAHGHKTWVLQDRHHKPWQGTYGHYAFTNFADPTVQKYNIDIAVEAAKLGFDDILYDYVRRADGKLSDMHIPGLTGDGETQVADFVRKTREALDAANVHAFLGASVFGESATRPKEIAQNIAMIGKYVDYVAPMVYPSHWNPGEYGVKNPNSMPYPIVNRSLKDFQKQLKGTNATVVPWLQDFSLGVTYTAAMVRAEEKAAADDGIHGFMLWNAGCVYHVDALPVIRS